MASSEIAGVFSALEIAASGLTAGRGRMNVIASNLANARTTRTEEGGAYKRLDPVYVTKPLRANSFDQVSRSLNLVQLDHVSKDPDPGQKVYEPSHPDADSSGYVEYPNVNVVTEMVNLMTASRAYEAGVTSIESIKSMAQAALRIGA